MAVHTNLVPDHLDFSAYIGRLMELKRDADRNKIAPNWIKVYQELPAEIEVPSEFIENAAERIHVTIDESLANILRTSGVYLSDIEFVVEIANNVEIRSSAIADRVIKGSRLKRFEKTISGAIRPALEAVFREMGISSESGLRSAIIRKTSREWARILVNKNVMLQEIVNVRCEIIRK
ncbi:hypothetical protein QMT40_002109 [Parvibaculaceae bacterium PLY_AMNH_Bact1]|nr:hypothetical protein QMT40_002109 [Parvibaculaceae bacterium PLY_AMNH_Bact1]